MVVTLPFDVFVYSFFCVTLLLLMMNSRLCNTHTHMHVRCIDKYYSCIVIVDSLSLSATTAAVADNPLYAYLCKRISISIVSDALGGDDVRRLSLG